MPTMPCLPPNPQAAIASIYLPSCPTSLLRLGGREQVPKREVINNILHLLDGVLDRVDSFAQNVVLEVEHLEAGVEVLDEGADPHGQLRVAEGHRVHSQAAELVDVRDE